jgi:hydrogenase maturation protein HypF
MGGVARSPPPDRGIMAVASGARRLGRRIDVRGVVQGVGFRPFVFRLARAYGLDGWVLNGDAGVRIHVEGSGEALDAFIRALQTEPPPAARITELAVASDPVDAVNGFEIRHSESVHQPTTRIAPDLPTCDACLGELLDPQDRRHRYPYINCTNCGPRFSIVRALPYDRAKTTMAEWALCRDCATEYHDPEDRRFHAQPVACHICGPSYRLMTPQREEVSGDEAIRSAARLLTDGRILAVKGIGGYHLACDADEPGAVMALRQRKYRKDQAFAVMVRDVSVAERTVRLTPSGRKLLSSTARPIILAPACIELAGVAPDNCDLGVMLPYTPLHHLLFALGAPERLVMTSGNRSSEPIAYRDEDALERLNGLADAFLIGERPIARRVDDSVVRDGALGPVILRRSRGLAPGAVAIFPTSAPILALGGDLKNAITLVVDGQAYVSQHIGDLAHLDSLRAFDETIRDLLAMYAIASDELTVVHDAHPQYVSSLHAATIPAMRTIAVQHHRAHVASVLAERGAFEERVLGLAFDGTGYGDDESIWGGEFVVGSVADGFDRVAHLRGAMLPGGDAAARHPVQAAAGFITQVTAAAGTFGESPFAFPPRYEQSCAILRSGIRVFPTTSVGRLFDTVAALTGFTRSMTFEGQAAMWLEHLARRAKTDSTDFPCRFTGIELDWRETLAAVIDARVRGIPPATIARAFHRSFARATASAVAMLADRYGVHIVVVSGGVMQNELLLADLQDALAPSRLQLWANREVPPNDGGVSLGQAALVLSSMRHECSTDRGNSEAPKSC